MTETLLLLKAHNKGYTKKDGTFVAPFDDKRVAAKSQMGLFGGWPKQVGHVAPKPMVPKVPKIMHPKVDEDGEDVGIMKPHKPTPAASWRDANEVATFIPGGDVPTSLHGVPFRVWRDHPKTEEGWDYVDGQMEDLDEPAMKLPPGKSASSGVVIEEQDGRIWLIHPTNEFGGYKASFPKGGAEEGLSLQANAIKECYEESGLRVEIVGLLGDFERSTSVARYYHARRVGGSPVDMGWESQAVSLVPKAKLLDLLNGRADAPVAHAIGAPKSAALPPETADDWTQIGKQLGTNPGGFFSDPSGAEWYCKFPQTSAHARNEVLASKLYELAGVKVPSMKLIWRKGKVGVASEYMPTLVHDKQALLDGAPGVRDGFAVDAWLANWDSVGAVYDNMLVDEKGEAVRIDPGGSLIFRAQGAPKGSAFGDTVGEIASLRDGKNMQATVVFGKVTDADIAAGVDKIAAISDADLADTVDKYGPGSQSERKELLDKIMARRKDLIARYGKK